MTFKVAIACIFVRACVCVTVGGRYFSTVIDVCPKAEFSVTYNRFVIHRIICVEIIVVTGCTL